WTIADTVAAGRRNPNYTIVSSLIDLALAEDCELCDFELRNHYGRGIFERGGKNVNIHDFIVDTLGKNDGPYHAIYTQSYGTPGAGQPFYSPSENIVIDRWSASNLERSFCAFMPTGGGRLTRGYVDGWQE